jgi:hypothetical protein
VGGEVGSGGAKREEGGRGVGSREQREGGVEEREIEEELWNGGLDRGSFERDSAGGLS